MASFSSSVINKSGRKFAPKVPVRRGGPGSGPGPSLNPAAARKSGSETRHPSQPPSQTPPQSAPEGTLNSQNASAPPETSEPPPPQRSHSPISPEQQADRAPQTPKQISPPVRHPIPVPVSKSTRPASTASPQHTSKPSVITPPSSSSSVVRPPSQSGPSGISNQQHASQDSNVRTDKTVDPDAQRNGTSIRKPGSTDDRPETVSSRPAKRIRVGEPASSPSAPKVQKSPKAQLPGSSHPDPSNATQKATSKRKSTGNKDDRRRAKRRRSTGEGPSDGAVDAGQEKKPRARRNRQATPENAESTEIVSTTVKMSDLCKDIRIGKKSKRETELQNMDWADVARKRKERDERRKKENSGDRRTGSVDNSTPVAAEQKPVASVGPQMKIVNGEIVLDTTSLQIDRHAEAARDMGDLEEVEENPLTRKINSSSFGKRTKTESWDQGLTDLFYRGLRMFGTDFMMISKMFPGRTRRHIKLKFSNEERRNPEKIKDTLLGPREPVSMEAYSDMTNTVYDDPRAIEEELEEEKRKIEEQHAREKEAREDLLRNPNADSDVLPSIETGGNTKRRHMDNRKKIPNARPMGGTEEILGTIDD